MKPTQKNIAEHAGVSQAAVSMILKGRDDVTFSPEVRARVLEIAGELGYKPRHRPTKTIGMLLPHQYSAREFVASTYYNRFLAGAMEEAGRLGYHLLLERWQGRVPEVVMQGKVDGLVAQGAFTESQVRQFAGVCPVVLLNWSMPGVNVSSFMPDNRGGLRMAVEYLAARGHRRIAFFGLGPGKPCLHQPERFEGYLAGLKRVGLDIRDEYIVMFNERKPDYSDHDELTARAVRMLHRLPQPPTAVLTYGDEHCLTFMRFAGQLSWRMPGELSLIGFDNVDACKYSEPALTSIDQPLERMAAAAVNDLVERIIEPDQPVRRVVFEVRLVERDSVARIDDA